MKLKTLTTLDDRLKKFNKFIDDMDFSKFRHRGKELFYGDCKDSFCVTCDEIVDDNMIKVIIKNLVNKYWKNFESGIDFHTYDENWFIEIKQKKDDSNVWEFMVESLDESVFFKFNTNFIVNL